MFTNQPTRARACAPLALVLATAAAPAGAATVESIETRAFASATNGPTETSGGQTDSPALPAQFGANLETGDVVNNTVFATATLSSNTSAAGAGLGIRVFADTNAGGSPFATVAGTGVATAESSFSSAITLGSQYMFELTGIIEGNIGGAAGVTLRGPGVAFGESLVFSTEDEVRFEIDESGVLDAGSYTLSGFDEASGSYEDGAAVFSFAAFEIDLSLMPVQPAAVPVPAALPLLGGALLSMLAYGRRRRGATPAG